MLSSIHPLGERAKHNRFHRTATAFAVGAVAGGAAVGAAAGGLGYLLGAGGLGDTGTALVSVATCIAAAADLTGRRVPGPHRQVDEHWLTRYRGWVYGLGYGVQLGAGITTFVTSAAVYAWIVAGVFSASPVAGAGIGAAFGMGRGLSLVAVRHVDRPDRLVELHRRLHARDARSRVTAGSLLLSAGLVAGVLTVGGSW